jgi:MFS family permease
VVLIYALAALRGLTDAVDMPTRQAFVSEMVGGEDLANAIALNSAQFSVARIVGPAIAAVVIATVGTAACFYANSVSFLAVVAAYLAMNKAELRPTPQAPRVNAVRQVGQGLRYALGTPDLLVILVLAAVIGTFGYNMQTIFPLLSTYVLHSGAAGLSELLVAMGLGSIMAGLVVAYRGKPTERLLFVCAAVFAVLLFAIGLSHWQLVTAVIAFALGIAGVLFMTTVNTRLQLLAPPEMRGRVMGMYALLFAGTTPIGSLLVGTLAAKTGVAPMVMEMAVPCAVGVFAAFWYARHRQGAPAAVTEPAKS